MKKIFEEKTGWLDDAYRTIIISTGFSFHFRRESSLCDTLMISEGLCAAVYSKCISNSTVLLQSSRTQDTKAHWLTHSWLLVMEWVGKYRWYWTLRIFPPHLLVWLLLNASPLWVLSPGVLFEFNAQWCVGSSWLVEKYLWQWQSRSWPPLTDNNKASAPLLHRRHLRTSQMYSFLIW